MADIVITSGKIKGDYCSYSYDERIESGSQAVQVSSEYIIHDDLRASFRQLVPHLVFICEETDHSNELEVAMDDVFKIPEESPLALKLQSYKVSAFKIVGSGDSQGVVITGQKKLQSGKILNLNTPVIKWEDDYLFANEMRVAVDRAQSEIIL